MVFIILLSNYNQKIVKFTLLSFNVFTVPKGVWKDCWYLISGYCHLPCSARSLNSLKLFSNLHSSQLLITTNLLQALINSPTLCMICKSNYTTPLLCGLKQNCNVRSKIPHIQILSPVSSLHVLCCFLSYFFLSFTLVFIPH